MKTTKVFFGALCLGVSFFGFAQQDADSTKVEQLDEVVISDSRFQLKRENSGKTVIKISKQEIERNQGRTVSQLINVQSGIEINGSRSNAGQNLGVYVRGGRNRQVLVLIDGVQTGDPSQINGEYDFRLLDLSQIESIEIIKGAASTLYGSGAASAVINITTKKASAKNVSGVVTSVFGTNQSEADQNNRLASFDNSVAFSGTLNKFTYRTGFFHQFSDGISAAKAGIGEKDEFSKYGLNVELGYKFSKAFSLNVYGNITDYKADIDGFNPGLTDTDDQITNNQSRAGLTSKYSYKNGSININAAYGEYERAYITPGFISENKSKSYVLDAYNKYIFNKTLYTIVGLNVIENKLEFDEEKTFTSIDPYANLVYVSDFGLNLNAGARLNNHNEYGSHFTYNLNPSFVIKQNDERYTKIFGSYSTSFITPSLFQLFSPFYGNINLAPEENTTIEGGIEFKLNNKFRISGLYFNREEVNTVLWDNGAYANASEDLTARGVEVELTANPISKLSITANYAFTEYKDVPARRIPKHKANLQLGYDICEKTFASLTYQYTHDRFENSFVEPLDSFSLFNFYISHTAIKNRLKLFAGLDNILNEEYEDVPGYVTLGRNARIGLQINL